MTEHVTCERIPTDVLLTREQLMERFGHWLETAGDSAEYDKDAATVSDAPDLHTLLGEMIALRQEVRMQNREQNKALRELEMTRQREDAARQAGTQRDDALKRLSCEIEERLSRQLAQTFFGVRDALERGASHLREERSRLQGAWRRWFQRRAQTQKTNILEGYELALQRFDCALQRQNISVMACLGMTFDPGCMMAIGTCCRPDLENGVVVEQVLCGFRRGSTVLRAAEVIVNRSENREGKNG